MAGTIKRHSNDPNPQVTITEGGSALDLTGAKVKFIMKADWVLAMGTTLDASTTTLTITNANSNSDEIGDIIEVGDLLLIDHEIMPVTTPLPALPFSATVSIAVTSRGYTIPATAASIRGATLVSCDGDTVYELSSTALDVDTITNPTGTTFRYTLNGSPDLSDLIVGGTITVANSGDPNNDGEFVITAVSDGSDYIEVTNASGVVEGSDSPATIVRNAQFFLSLDGGANTAVTVKESDTAGNLTMAQLVTDVNTALADASLDSDIVASATGNRLIFSTVDTGTSASIQLSSPNDEAENQLGLSAAIDVGESSHATTATSHADGTTVTLLKIPAGVGRVSSASSGIAAYEWMSGDTDKAGTFYCEWEITLNGRTFTIPIDDSYTIIIEPDYNDRLVPEGE